MNQERCFAENIIEDLETISLRLNDQLRDSQKELNILYEDRDIGAYRDIEAYRGTEAYYQDLYEMVERLDSARVHLYVAGEYLRGNSEWAFLRDVAEENLFEERKGA
jgi:hypothetical protein